MSEQACQTSTESAARAPANTAAEDLAITLFAESLRLARLADHERSGRTEEFLLRMRQGREAELSEQNLRDGMDTLRRLRDEDRAAANRARLEMAHLVNALFTGYWNQVSGDLQLMLNEYAESLGYDNALALARAHDRGLLNVALPDVLAADE